MASKLDQIAKYILESAGLLSKIIINEEDDEPYLVALEKSLDINYSCISNNVNSIGIRNSSNKQISEQFFTGNLECTDPHNFASFSTTETSGSSTYREYWTPTIPTTSLDSSYVNADIPMLEDMAPFPPSFYYNIGMMLILVYNPSSITHTSCDDSNLISQSIDSQLSTNMNNHVPKVDSLYKEFDAIRITKILTSLMELNVGVKNIQIGRDDDESNKYVPKTNDISFLDLLLLHTEDNSFLGEKNIIELERKMEGQQSSHEVLDNIQASSDSVPKKRTIPLIVSIFKHFSSLPQLEGHVNLIVRRFRNSVTLSNNSLQQNEIDTKNRNDHLQHLQKSQIYQEQLENELKAHISSLELILGMIYEHSDVKLRKKFRMRIGSMLQTFTHMNRSSSTPTGALFTNIGVENTNATGIDSILRILLRILQGIQLRIEREANLMNSGYESRSVVNESYRELLFKLLIPLHRPSGFLLWRDQTPLIGLYHEPLVQCIGVIISLDKSLIGKVIQSILHPDIWPIDGNGPSRGNANTPKLVLLLHEIDTYLGLLNFGTGEGGYDNPRLLSDIILPLVLRLSSCISSDNSRASERALQFFRNKQFAYLVHSHLSVTISPLLRALCRMDTNMEVPWNPTVKKMTLLVLKELEDYDKDIFAEGCKQIFRGDTSQNKLAEKDMNEIMHVADNHVSQHVVELGSQNKVVPNENMHSLKHAMGSWRPPVKSQRIDAGSSLSSSLSMPPPKSRPANSAQPPLTITGVAPWAMTIGKSNNTISSQKSRPVDGAQPPLTITGVAPWAMTSGTSKSMSPGSNKIPSRLPEINKSNNYTNQIDTSKEVDNHQHDELMTNALSKVKHYMESLKPASGDGESEDGISSWAKSQMSESPVLLPNLKFHDLVFGQVLGTGAFSVVKYARQIVKNTTRSNWPEYAVKIVSTQKIAELGYEQSINREIVILGMMCHPSIARLISSFRFRDGAYLILEYANGGDLHSILKKYGSFDEQSTKFIIGEVVAALQSIHELGFVFGDLKPENILVTESGHIKLTDFGGCRPFTDAAKKRVSDAGRNIVKSLRDGDWKEVVSAVVNDSDTSMDVEEQEEDQRIEGTTAYLSPEVILGGYPTVATDSWALGCVLFQTLSGRPPLLEENEHDTKQKIVSFDLKNTNESSEDFFLESLGKEIFSGTAKILIKRLLSKNSDERPNMISISHDAFFEGVDVFSLYRKTAHKLNVGSLAPVADAKWSRRQFSSIWAPQPKAYSITSSSEEMKNTHGRNNSPILEGDESEGSFTIASNGVKLSKVIEIK